MQKRYNRHTVKKIGNTTIRISDLYLVRTPEAVEAILERIKRNAQLSLSADEKNQRSEQ